MKKVLRFTASWCGPCKMLAKNLEEAALGLPIEVIDVDVNKELAQQYEVRSIPTLIMKNGISESSRLVGLQTTTNIKLWALQ